MMLLGLWMGSYDRKLLMLLLGVIVRVRWIFGFFVFFSVLSVKCILGRFLLLI